MASQLRQRSSFTAALRSRRPFAGVAVFQRSSVAAAIRSLCPFAGVAVGQRASFTATSFRQRSSVASSPFPHSPATPSTSPPSSLPATYQAPAWRVSAPFPPSPAGDIFRSLRPFAGVAVCQRASFTASFSFAGKPRAFMTSTNGRQMGVRARNAAALRLMQLKCPAMYTSRRKFFDMSPPSPYGSNILVLLRLAIRLLKRVKKSEIFGKVEQDVREGLMKKAGSTIVSKIVSGIAALWNWVMKKGRLGEKTVTENKGDPKEEKKGRETREYKLSIKLSIK